LSEGGFNLRKFMTNSVNLQQKINIKESDSTVNVESVPVKEEDKTYTKHILRGRLEQQDDEQKMVELCSR